MQKTNIVSKLEKFLNDYCVFAFPGVAFPIALWIVATHCFEAFDAFAYMVITASIKRCGKTRLSELIGFASHDAVSSSAMTPSTLFRSITERKPTIVFDEAEILSGESASIMRAVLNVGYRKGQTIPRTEGRIVREFKTYCPKVFILIGDVYDTLRDRSIIIEMKRGEPRERFSYDLAKDNGKALGEEVKSELESLRADLQSEYMNASARFLNDRDEEIWRPLFTLCSLFCHERTEELQRIAVDLSSLKTSEKRRYFDLAGEEAKAQDDEYATRLLRDLRACFHERERVLFSNQVIERLQGLPLAPWRVFKGVGLNMQNLADMLSRFGIRPVMVRQGNKINRGYRREHVDAAIKHQA